RFGNPQAFLRRGSDKGPSSSNRCWQEWVSGLSACGRRFASNHLLAFAQMFRGYDSVGSIRNPNADLDGANEFALRHPEGFFAVPAAFLLISRFCVSLGIFWRWIPRRL